MSNRTKENTMRQRAWWLSEQHWCCYHENGKGDRVHRADEIQCRHCGKPRPPLRRREAAADMLSDIELDWVEEAIKSRAAQKR